jgi:hypothetical protein
MGYTVLDMQRDCLLAANKAQVDNSKDDIVDALDELIHAIDEPPPGTGEGGEEEIDPAAIINKLQEAQDERKDDRKDRAADRRSDRRKAV